MEMVAIYFWEGHQGTAQCEPNFFHSANFILFFFVPLAPSI